MSTQPMEPEWRRCDHHWVWHIGPAIDHSVNVAQCSQCGHLRADVWPEGQRIKRRPAWRWLMSWVR